MSQDREQLFDDWAARYDESIRSCDGFPFLGYDRVLDEIVASAAPQSGHQVLDLGIGTGALARLFGIRGCDVWGVDFSREMLSLAAKRYPLMKLLKANLLESWPNDLPSGFDAIVSAYVFHEFPNAGKLHIIREAVDRLAPGGRLIIGDIAFPSRQVRGSAREQWALDWDDEEFYWAYDEIAEPLATLDVVASYRQVSECGGILVITR